jgi:hypothetical protein
MFVSFIANNDLHRRRWQLNFIQQLLLQPIVKNENQHASGS